jgi:hypothetical protein
MKRIALAAIPIPLACVSMSCLESGLATGIDSRRSVATRNRSCVFKAALRAGAVHRSSITSSAGAALEALGVRPRSRLCSEP